MAKVFPETADVVKDAVAKAHAWTSEEECKKEASTSTGPLRIRRTCNRGALLGIFCCLIAAPLISLGIALIVTFSQLEHVTMTLTSLHLEATDEQDAALVYANVDMGDFEPAHGIKAISGSCAVRDGNLGDVIVEVELAEPFVYYFGTRSRVVIEITKGSWGALGHALNTSENFQLDLGCNFQLAVDIFRTGITVKHSPNKAWGVETQSVRSSAKVAPGVLTPDECEPIDDRAVTKFLNFSGAPDYQVNKPLPRGLGHQERLTAMLQQHLVISIPRGDGAAFVFDFLHMIDTSIRIGIIYHEANFGAIEISTSVNTKVQAVVDNRTCATTIKVPLAVVGSLDIPGFAAAVLTSMSNSHTEINATTDRADYFLHVNADDHVGDRQIKMKAKSPQTAVARAFGERHVLGWRSEGDSSFARRLFESGSVSGSQDYSGEFKETIYFDDADFIVYHTKLQDGPIMSLISDLSLRIGDVEAKASAFLSWWREMEILTINVSGHLVNLEENTTYSVHIGGNVTWWNKVLSLSVTFHEDATKWFEFDVNADLDGDGQGSTMSTSFSVFVKDLIDLMWSHSAKESEDVETHYAGMDIRHSTNVKAWQTLPTSIDMKPDATDMNATYYYEKEDFAMVSNMSGWVSLNRSRPRTLMSAAMDMEGVCNGSAVEGIDPICTRCVGKDSEGEEWDVDPMLCGGFAITEATTTKPTKRSDRRRRKKRQLSERSLLSKRRLHERWLSKKKKKTSGPTCSKDMLENCETQKACAGAMKDGSTDLICEEWDPSNCRCRRCWEHDIDSCRTEEKCTTLAAQLGISEGYVWNPRRNRCLQCKSDNFAGCPTEAACTAANAEATLICEEWDPTCKDGSCRRCWQHDLDACRSEDQCTELAAQKALREEGLVWNAKQSRCRRCKSDDYSGCPDAKSCKDAQKWATMVCEEWDPTQCSCRRCWEHDPDACRTQKECKTLTSHPKLTDEGFVWNAQRNRCKRCKPDDFDGCPTDELCKAANAEASMICEEWDPSNCRCRRCWQHDMDACRSEGSCTDLAAHPEMMLVGIVWNARQNRCRRCTSDDFDGCPTDELCKAATSDAGMICEEWDPSNCRCRRCWQHDADACRTEDSCMGLQTFGFVWNARDERCKRCSSDDFSGCQTEETCKTANAEASMLCEEWDPNQCRCRRCWKHDTDACRSEDACMTVAADPTTQNDGLIWNDKQSRCRRCKSDDFSGCPTEESCKAANADATMICDESDPSNCHCRRCWQHDTDACRTKDACMRLAADPALESVSFVWKEDDQRCRRCGRDDSSGCDTKETCESMQLSWGTTVWNEDEQRCRNCGRHDMSGCNSKEMCENTTLDYGVAVWDEDESSCRRCSRHELEYCTQHLCEELTVEAGVLAAWVSSEDRCVIIQRQPQWRQDSCCANSVLYDMMTDMLKMTMGTVKSETLGHEMDEDGKISNFDVRQITEDAPRFVDLQVKESDDIDNMSMMGAIKNSTNKQVMEQMSVNVAENDFGGYDMNVTLKDDNQSDSIKFRGGWTDMGAYISTWQKDEGLLFSWTYSSIKAENATDFGMQFMVKETTMVTMSGSTGDGHLEIYSHVYEDGSIDGKKVCNLTGTVSAKADQARISLALEGSENESIFRQAGHFNNSDSAGILDFSLEIGEDQDEVLISASANMPKSGGQMNGTITVEIKSDTDNDIYVLSGISDSDFKVMDNAPLDWHQWKSEVAYDSTGVDLHVSTYIVRNPDGDLGRLGVEVDVTNLTIDDKPACSTTSLTMVLPYDEESATPALLAPGASGQTPGNITQCPELPSWVQPQRIPLPPAPRRRAPIAPAPRKPASRKPSSRKPSSRKPSSRKPSSRRPTGKKPALSVRKPAPSKPEQRRRAPSKRTPAPQKAPPRTPAPQKAPPDNTAENKTAEDEPSKVPASRRSAKRKPSSRKRNSRARRPSKRRPAPRTSNRKRARRRRSRGRR